MEFKDLKDSEAELFLRTKEEILMIELPTKLVEDLEALKDKIKAHDLLEVLIKSTKGMISAMKGLDHGDYQYEDSNGENVKIKKSKQRQ